MLSENVTIFVISGRTTRRCHIRHIYEEYNLNTSRIKPVASLFITALLWSTGGILIKNVDASPFVIAALRSFLGSFTLMIVFRRLPSVIARNRDGKMNREKTFFKIAAGICYSLTMISFVLANKMTSAANAILLQYTSPVWIIIFGPLLLKEKNTAIDYITVAGVLGGMVLFVLDGLQNGNTAGNALSIFSGIVFAATIIFLRKQKDSLPSDSLILSNIITFAVLFPVCLFTGLFSKALFTPANGIFILILGVFQIGLASAFYTYGISKVTALGTVLITMVEPLMNPVWVFIFNGERPSGNSIAGGIVILGFVILRTILKNR